MIIQKNIQYDTGWGINMATNGKAEVLHYTCATFGMRQCFVARRLVKYLRESINDISLTLKMRREDIQHKTGWGINITKDGKIEILHYSLLTQQEEKIFSYARSFRLYHDFSIETSRKSDVKAELARLRSRNTMDDIQEDKNTPTHTETPDISQPSPAHHSKTKPIITNTFRYIYASFAIIQWYIATTIRDEIKQILEQRR